MIEHIKNKPFGLFLTPIILMLILSVFIGMVSAETLEVAHYTFNETSGTTLTDIAENYNGTNTGVTINQTGKINKSYYFDGSNSHISIPNISEIKGSDELSISFWIKRDKINANQYIITFTNYASGLRYYYFSAEFNTNNKLIFKINKANNDTANQIELISDYDFSTNQNWHYITLIFKGDNYAKMYIDNSLDDSQTTNIFANINDASSSFPLSMGEYYDDGFTNLVTFQGSLDDTRIYDFALDTTDIALIYNNGTGTETPLNELRVPIVISNPAPPIYPTISYDWNGSFIDIDYNSDYTYKYSFGFNDTDSLDDDEVYVDVNLTLDYDQNTIKYFDLDYTPTVDQISDTNYSFFKVYRYLDSVYDSNYTSWSADTFTVLDPIVFDFNAPEYPDWANLFYPTKSYSSSAHYQDKSYQSGVTTYKYDLGSNDTNSLDGSQEYWMSNVDITSTDGNVDAYFEHTISVADKGKTLFAFLTMKRYYNDVFIDSATEWTNSFDINYGRFRTQFYDENCATALDGNVNFYNSVEIPVDENGLADIWLEDYISTDGEAIETEAWREVDGTITHSKRDFDYYLYLTRSYDLNFALYPVDTGATIEFLVKDMLDNVWANKYLMFVKSDLDICPQPQTLLDSFNSESGSTTNKRGIRFGVEDDCYIQSFDIEQTVNYADSWELYDYTMGNLLDSGTGLTNTTTNVETNTAIKLDSNCEYSIVLFNDDGGSAKFGYTNNYLATPVVTDYISFTNGCNNGGLACTSTDPYIVTGVNIIDASAYMAFFKEPIVEVKKLNSSGKGSFYLDSDGNYSAVLIDEMGSIITQYQKTTVNMKKPKDEITNADISPYDVDVGGLLLYSLSNQTASDINFNIFAGTTDYYDFTVVDYNATPTDRAYIPRKYAVRIPFGTDYINTYNLQPYLITDVDGIIPQIKVIDQLNRAVNDAVVIVYKYINGEYSVVESAITDSTGSMSWSAYPLDSYTVAVYYKEELKGTYVLRPRTSDDVYYIKIALSEDDELSVPDIFNISWGDTKEFFNFNSENVAIDNAVISNTKSNMTFYTAYLYQGNTLIDSDSNGIDYDDTVIINYEFDCTTINKSYSTATIKIIVEYGDGLTKDFTRIVSVSGRTTNPMTYFEGASDDFGQPLSAIIAIFITALLIAMLSFSGLPLGKLGVALFGMFVLSLFVWFGWLDSGMLVFGFDVSRFMFILVVMAIAYFAFKESAR